MIDGREVGAGAGRHELGGGRMGQGESFSAVNCALFPPFCGLDLHEGHLWVGGTLWPWRSLELSLACW
jgi:hypothetical protein